MNWYVWAISGLVVFNFYTIYRLYLLQKALDQSILDNTIAIAMLSTMKEQLESSDKFKNDANEDFIKFLSDSRDWAFEYIENTITVINEIIEECRNETNQGHLGDYRTGPILMGIVKKLLPLVEESNNKQ